MAALPPIIPSLSHYTFERVLGAGPRSTVAKYTRNGIPYTIKFIPEMIVSRDTKREIQILYELSQDDYPIPKIYFYGRMLGETIRIGMPAEARSSIRPHTQHTVIVMEYIEGQTLEEYLLKNNPIDPQSIYNIAVWLFDILWHLHTLNLVHRDIKPENIIVAIVPEMHLAMSLKLYLVDFGFACSVTDKLPTTCPIIVYGTPLYLSPELWDWDIALPKYPAFDVWAAGVTLYRLLNNDYPWGVTEEEQDKYGGTELQKILSNRILKEPAKPGKILHPVSDVIALALDKRIEYRPSAHELYQQLVGVSVPSQAPPILTYQY